MEEVMTKLSLENKKKILAVEARLLKLDFIDWSKDGCPHTLHDSVNGAHTSTIQVFTEINTSMLVIRPCIVHLHEYLENGWAKL